MNAFFRLLVLGLVLALAVPANAAQLNKIAAVVNGQMITMFDLQKNAAAEIVGSHLNPNNPAQQAQCDAIFNKVLDQMILDILFEQEAKRLKIAISDQDIDNEITARYKSMGLTKQQFEQQLASQNTRLADVRATVRKNIIRNKIMGMEVARRVVVSASEVRQYYEAHKSTMYNRKGLHIAICPYPPQIPNVRAIAAQVKSGAMSWETAVQKYSALPIAAQNGGPSRANGGDIGAWDRIWNRMPDDLRSHLAGLQPGQASDLFEFNKFKMQARLFRFGNNQEPLRIMTFEEARPQIEEMLRGPKMEVRFQEYSRQLLSKANIDRRIGTASMPAMQKLGK